MSSVAASLIPFLEHDDANRALMGSNMMRQAVPLMAPEAPIVGTGIEHYVARDSRTLVEAEGDGEVIFVDSTKITIKYDRTDKERLVSFDDDVKTYNLIKYIRTNQSTSINQKPIVRKGQKVTKGQILTEGYATQGGDLALGRNLKVAFMPWKGYNYEDAIVISEKIVKEDLFTSIHIEEFTLEVRDTKRGLEELTNDIPNVSADATKDLDENGLIRVGADVKEGDILIGKITPKGETDPTPEEKLLRAIFGDKAGDVKNASLKAGPSMKGVVIGKRLFSRVVKDRKAKSKDKDIIAELDAECQKELDALKARMMEKLMSMLNGRTSTGVYNNFKETIIPKKVKFTQKALSQIDYMTVNPYKWTTDAEINDCIVKLVNNYNIKCKEINGVYSRKKNVASVGDELPNGIVQMAKVYVAQKRKLNIGDKMAGRHGNKGIVSRIVREEDMPFLEDGTPVDIVLNPLGVPSRMNLGQIYETVLGWAGHELGLKFATPIFDGATLEEINEYMKKAGLPENGRVQLYDGETGEPFDQQATVGYIYMLKLHHMVDDKMHARSIGPYSLITQQPLGGKAQFGGQRFGEMEVWALEAFGASNVLQEILTVKSDDVVGRAKAYEAIVKGENMPTPGIPESFNVLVHELRGLGLEITFE
jgi:DNA-directed RNA polymerase subunit beta